MNLSEPALERLVSGNPAVAEAVRLTLTGLLERRVSQRIRSRDHSVWRSDPREISDRLGWLDAGEFLGPHLGELESFVDQVRREGYRDLVLLGMGGSCLGPEVLRSVFGPAPGFPRLTMLDSTVPERVAEVRASIDPARTIFIVSSKSGGTIETLSFYRYFRGQVELALPAGDAGKNFVAITDSGTPLERLAHEASFRRVFLNPADIGGRYSVLSWFGMLPAALAGVDVRELLDSAQSMRNCCLEGEPEQNPGLVLGALLGSAALAGRDKVTLVAPPAFEAFGLWVEQMIAESLGKEGSGIVPVAGEPLLSPDCYGNDRLFVFLQTGDCGELAARVDSLEQAGHPVVRLEIGSKSDIGAEFYRWEYATAVAGSVLGLHPFDQPDVQGAKDNTDRLLKTYLEQGSLPAPETSGSLSALLECARPGDYLAILPYITPDDQDEELLFELRTRAMRKYRIATTAGYGPRYLHSTGQLHKGGPGTGLYLHLTTGINRELPIPGQRYGFDVLSAAQAIGDYEALSKLGRRIVSVDLGDNVPAGLRSLVDEF